MPRLCEEVGKHDGQGLSPIPKVLGKSQLLRVERCSCMMETAAAAVASDPLFYSEALHSCKMRSMEQMENKGILVI